MNSRGTVNYIYQCSIDQKDGMCQNKNKNLVYWTSMCVETRWGQEALQGVQILILSI